MTAVSPASTAAPPHPALRGQTVVVIGGSAGIGLETARRAREEGADVILTARDPDRLQRAGLELDAGALITALTAALPALTRNLALELAPIRVNLIAAGFVDTPLSATLLGDQLDARREQLRTTLPIRRVVGPADIAALAIHLMTNTAITGATFDIDGGQQLVEGRGP
jgi:NAD(P)-dependent dehydrogenase (short-subunit alcohol dehydrogenase family)